MSDITPCENTPLENIRDWVMRSPLILTWHGLGVLTFEDRHKGVVHSYDVSEVDGTIHFRVSVGSNDFLEPRGGVGNNTALESVEDLMRLVYLCRYSTATVHSIIRPLDVGPVRG